MAIAASCGVGDAGIASDTLQVDAQLLENTWHIKLSHTLDEVASGQVRVQLLHPDLTVGDDGEGLGAIVDVAGLGKGAFAVFDRTEAAIGVFDSAGAHQRRFGRRGEGPGEFLAPWALAAAGDKLVAVQSSRTQVFTVFDSAGTLLGTMNATDGGDWIRPRFRTPLLDIDGFQHGPEDVTRRIRRFGENAFVHQLQENENDFLDTAPPYPSLAPPTYLIHYAIDLQVVDTIAVLAGPPTIKVDGVPGAFNLFAQPLFSGRPIWTTGADWIALSHGDSLRATVEDRAGQPVAIVEWPDRRRVVTDDERREAARWIIGNQVVNSSTSHEMFRRASRRDINEGINQTAFDLTPIAERVPHVTAAYGSGACLFLAGHSATDWSDGTARTWIAVNVRRGSLEGVFKLAVPEGDRPLELGRKGRAVRDIDGDFIFTTHRDGMGTSIVQRYPLPAMDCSTEEVAVEGTL